MKVSPSVERSRRQSRPARAHKVTMRIENGGKFMELRRLLVWSSLVVVPSVVMEAATLSTLTQKADAIVVGTVSSRVQSSNAIAFDINVERVINGNLGATVIHVLHSWQADGTMASGTVNSVLHGMWFLKRGSTQWDILQARNGLSVDSLFLPALAMPPLGAFATPANASLLDVLTFEAAAGIQASGQSPQTLLELLGMSDGPAVDAVLSIYLNSADTGQRAIGLTGLIRRGRPGLLATVVQVWPSISNDLNRRHVVSALADAWRDPSASSVQQLETIADTVGTAELRQSAIRALASIHTREALPFLTKLLAGADPERTLAIFGLASFANGCPIQTPDNVASMAYLFCSQPSPYRGPDTLQNFILSGSAAASVSSAASFWQGWWQSHSELH